jgi:hypothetical protein
MKNLFKKLRTGLPGGKEVVPLGTVCILLQLPPRGKNLSSPLNYSQLFKSRFKNSTTNKKILENLLETTGPMES